MKTLKTTLLSTIFVTALGFAIGLIAAPGDSYGCNLGVRHNPNVSEPCETDGGGGGPTTLAALCGFALTDDTTIRKTNETINGVCSIDLFGNSLSIQQVTITVTGEGNLIIEDTGGGQLRIIDSTITLAGSLDIDLTGDITIRRNITINVGDDENVDISGRGINIRDAGLSSNDINGAVAIFTLTGTAEISFKDIVLDDFDQVNIISTFNDEVFVFGSDFDAAAVTITTTGDCMWKDNTNPSASQCLP